MYQDIGNYKKGEIADGGYFTQSRTARAKILSAPEILLKLEHSLPLLTRTNETLEAFRKLGYQQGVASKLVNLAMIEYLMGDHQSAKLNALECLDTCIEVGDVVDIRNVFELFAALCLDNGEPLNAARLSGAAAGRCEAIDHAHELVERKFRELYLEKLRVALTKNEFAEAYEEGRLMSVDEAIALMLEDKSRFEDRGGKLRLIRSTIS